MTLRLDHSPGAVVATAWGPGGAWALDHAPGLIGAEDDLSAFEPHDDVMAQVWKEHRSVRLTRALDVVRTLITAILEQKVVGMEARRAWRRMTKDVSEPAPGEGGLLLPPDPAQWPSSRTTGSTRGGWSDAARRWCEPSVRGRRPSRRSQVPFDEARRRLEVMPGIGPWTTAEVMRLSFGDPDAVSVGDYHLPDVVAWALAGEPRADDARMLELLEPYRGQRGRVQRLLEASHISPPAWAPGWKPARSRSSRTRPEAERTPSRPRPSRRRRGPASWPAAASACPSRG